jgi:hypothetical protein
MRAPSRMLLGTVCGVVGVFAGCAALLMTATATQPVAPTILEQIPPGARVTLRNHTSHGGSETRTETTGTVLHASRDGIALMNVQVQSRQMTATPVLSKTPYVSRLFKNTGVGMDSVPVLWVDADKIAEATVIAAPDPNVQTPSLALDTNRLQREHQQFERIGIDFDYATGAVTQSPSVPLR